MHDCDVMVCVGARFDDRITGRLDAFSPESKKIHIDIDPSSINKNVKVDIGIVGDCAHVLEDMIAACGGRKLARPTRPRWPTGGAQIDGWRARNSLRLPPTPRAIIKPQHAIAAALRADQGPRRLHHHRGRPAPDVGGAVLPLRGAEPLDDLRRPGHHGLWPAGRRSARRWRIPTALVIDIAGEASILMNMQEMSTAVQYRPAGQDLHPQQRVHGHGAPVAGAAARRALLARATRDRLPDFVKLAEAYGGVGIRCRDPAELDGEDPGDDRHADAGDLRLPWSTKEENCFPMIPSGKAHNEMILGDAGATSARSSTPRAASWCRRLSPSPGGGGPQGGWGDAEEG